MKYILFLSLWLISITADASTVRIRILNSYLITSINLSALQGSYEIRSGSKVLHAFSGDSGAVFKLGNTGIRITAGSKTFFVTDSVAVVATSPTSTLSVDLPENPGAKGLYDDDLQIIYASDRMNLLNVISLEKYIGSVLAGEIGYNAQPEFLKAKAIICRTYALSNPTRHAAEGFLLCSDTHCQVYKGREANTIQILLAVEATAGTIIIDTSGNSILSAFHSNCGGITQNSEDAWSSNLPYLKSVTDTFCLKQKNARWSVSFPLQQWESYMTAQGLPGEGTEAPDLIRRHREFVYKGKKVMSRKIRTDWNLKSSWFVVTAGSDSVNLEGRGYGHGVGLCQEGAMNMAASGFSYKQIIHYYYTGVTITRKD